MTIERFESILNQPESDILDFKREQYDFSDDSKNIKTAKFVKDIISFCNTIRTETSYIILGIDLSESGDKELLGINEHIDDAVFQEKIKNKVSPIPVFSYSTIKYKNKVFGIIDIPIKKYEEPIFPIIKIKGLEIGKVYFRRGSSNSEATGREVISLSRWLESLPHEDFSNINDELSEILLNVTSNAIPLSKSIALTLKLARKHSLSKLIKFCEGELAGWDDRMDNINVEVELSYRMSNVIMTPNNVEVNPYSFVELNSHQLLNELRRVDKSALEKRMLFPQPITDIENYLEEFSLKKNNSLIVFTSTADALFDNPKFADIKIRNYTTVHNFESIYQGVKKKLISQLIELN